MRWNLRPGVDPRFPIPWWFYFTRDFWVALWWNLAGPVYQWLYFAGLIDMEEGGYYRDATISALGTRPRARPDWW